MQVAKPVMRAVLYILRSLLMLGAIVLFCWFCFQEAKQVSSLIVVTTEGMTARAETIINAGDPDKYDPDSLSEYFLSDVLMSDSLLNADLYQEYVIGNYDYSIKIDSVHVFPWSQKAKVEIHEIVSQIEGRLDDSLMNEDGELPKTAPQWEEKNYSLTMVKNPAGRWYIGAVDEAKENE